ncbi:MAG TPA: T9SS type A sorting domain-containing protein, partial [Ohtaekwangia sp.]|nr:T9SS type A sorting domain-containing protein [Ohtaekwangia sp.]
TNYDNSVYFNGFSNVVNGDQAWLVSPLLDFSDIDEASMFFDLSYGYRSGTSDNLKVLASTDCGQTFDLTLFDKAGIVLSTEPTGVSWMPSSDKNWSRKYISLAALARQPDARIAFVFTNNHGNNLYLDNIEFFTADNIDPVRVEKVFSVYPNPGSSDELKLTLDLPERGDIRIEMVDARGKIVWNHFMQNALNQTLSLPVWNEAPGLYFVRVVTSGKIYNQKLILLQP